MSIVLEALEKAQKEKNKEKAPAKIWKEHKSSKPDVKETLEKERKTRLILPVRPRFHKKIFIFVFVVVNLIFAGWWLKYNNSIVYENSSNKSHISIPRDLPVLFTKSLLLEDVHEENVIEELPALNVTGVVWDEKDPIVLVNGRFLKKGDEIIGAKVIDIQLHEVRFLFKDKEFTISVE